MGILCAWLSFPAYGQLTGFQAADKISRENRSRVDSFAGNGIDTGTGAFVTSKTLLLQRGVRPVSLTMSYNSLLTSTAGAMGRGWSHEYEAYITGDPNGVMTVYWDANRKNSYRYSSGINYDPVDEAVAHDKLIKDGNHWVLTLQDGTEYSFAEDGGVLEFIENRTGQRIDVIRSNTTGQLLGVQESSGKRISFNYDEASGRIAYLSDSGDRLVAFDYGPGGLLEAIHGPGTMGLTQGGSFNPTVAIPDNGMVTRELNITDGPERMGLVRFNFLVIDHLRPTDLVVRMTSPQGTTVQFTTNQTDGLWLLTGQVMTDFDGEDPRGTWRLTVQDTRAGQTGKINGWVMRLTEYTNPAFFSYNGNGQITAATDGLGMRLYANGYDAQGRIAMQDDGRDDNKLAQIHYGESFNNVTTTYQDRTGATATLEHDGNYRLTATTDPLGAKTTYGYNSNGDRTMIRDPLGHTARFGFSAEGDLISYIDTGGAVWTFEHNDGDVTSIRDPLGKRTDITYTNHRVTRVKDAECMIQPGCAGNTKGWGANGEMMSNLRGDGVGVNYTWQQGRPVGAARPTGDGNETAEYDAIGRTIRSENVSGFATTFTYNSASQLLTRTDALGLVNSQEYDQRGQPIRSTNARGDSTRYAYDGNGNLISQTNPLSETTTYSYDGEDRMIRTQGPDGHGTFAEFDAAGRMTRRGDDSGAFVRYEYDAVGNRTATYDANDVLMEEVTYNDRDQPVTTTDAFGNTVTTQYDDLARPVSITDAAGNTETYDYDRNDRLVTFRDSLNRTFTTAYGQSDTVTDITNALGETIHFEYNKANQVTRVDSPDGRNFHSNYNNRDLLSYESVGNDYISYSYDDIGRLIEEDYRNEKVVQFDLDDNGNTTAVRVQQQGSSSSTRLRFDYDALDRVTRFQNADGDVLRYTYTAAGNVASITYPDGKQVRYVYDVADRLSEIIDWADRHTHYSYDANGKLLRVELPNGVVQDSVYDQGGRLTRRTDHTATATIVDLRYSFNELNHLADVRMMPAAAAYIPQAVSMTFGPDDSIATYNGASVQYNQRGGMSYGPVGDNFQQLEYNQSGALTRAGSRTYTYDELGNMIRISGPEGTTRLVVDPVPEFSQILVSSGPQGATRYVWGPGLVYEEANGSLRVYHYDYTGNTVAITDASGQIIGTFSYGPYGETAATSGVSTPFQFGGVLGVYTDANGLVQMRFRWYSPQLRRFVDEDPEFGRPGSSASLNRYGYGGLNPINYNDPSGRFLNIVAGAVAGAVVNVAVKVVVTRVVEGRWPTKGELIGAAVDGAIAGGLLAACGPGCGYLASAAIGGLAAGGGTLTQQLVDDGEVNWAEVGISAGIGAAFGAAGAKPNAKAARGGSSEVAERGAGSARSVRSTRPKPASPNSATKSSSGNLLKPPKRSSVILQPKSTRPAPTLGETIRDVAGKSAKRFVIGSVGGIASGVIDKKVGSKVPILRSGIRADGLESVSASQSDGGGSIGSSTGRFRHWKIYSTALGLSGMPQPSPAPALGVY